MTHEEQLYFGLGYDTFILLIFFIAYKFPPKKINYFYGYRTSRSMKNEETWKVAQEYSAKKSIVLALWSFSFPPLFYFIYPEYNFLLSVIINTFLVLLIFPFTERFLKARFDSK